MLSRVLWHIHLCRGGQSGGALFAVFVGVAADFKGAKVVHPFVLALLVAQILLWYGVRWTSRAGTGDQVEGQLERSPSLTEQLPPEVAAVPQLDGDGAKVSVSSEQSTLENRVVNERRVVIYQYIATVSRDLHKALLATPIHAGQEDPSHDHSSQERHDDGLKDPGALCARREAGQEGEEGLIEESVNSSQGYVRTASCNVQRLWLPRWKGGMPYVISD